MRALTAEAIFHLMLQSVRRAFRPTSGVTAILLLVSPAAISQIVPAQHAVDASELLQLRLELAEQKKQIAELRLLVLDQKKQLDSLKNPSVLPPATVPAAPALPASQPLQLHIGDASVTPVGFMDLTGTWRGTNAGTGLQTNFGSIPYSKTPQGRLTETRLSAVNSRLGLRVDARAKGASLLGYFEGDFVGNAPANSQVSSNSMTYRLRLYFVDLRKGKWEMLAGQSWSMLTPNRKGISALPADLFYSHVADVNYMNGLPWTRQPGIRVLLHPNKSVTMGLSLENAEQYIGGSGGGGLVTLPAAFRDTNFYNEVNNGSTGVAAPNLHPDIIAKVAFDHRLAGRDLHFEVAGVERTFKTFHPATNKFFTKAGGGFSANINWELIKNLHLVSNNFYSDGGGRYLFGVAPDLIVRANGSPSLIRASSTVSGLEAQVGKTLLYAYYGGIYIGRNTALDANGSSPIGYGYAGSSNSQNRTTQELTGGLTQTLWRDGRYGALQVMLQYAWFFRNPWFVTPNLPRSASENAMWFNFRYVLPGAAPVLEH